MKKNRLVIIAFAASLIFLNGCAEKPSSGNISTNSAQENGGGTGETQYKLLYNPPAGGNPENIGKIVFASDDGKTTNADYDLYTINPDGSGKTRLTTFGKFIDHPAWSPEHSRIAYSAHVDEGNTDKIFIMTADGSETIDS